MRTWARKRLADVLRTDKMLSCCRSSAWKASGVTPTCTSIAWEMSRNPCHRTCPVSTDSVDLEECGH